MIYEKLPLSRYVKVEGGFAFKSSQFVEDGIPIIRISNIVEGKVDIKNCVKYPIESYEIFKRYEVENGDILIAMSGATTGKIGITKEVKGKILLNQRVGNFKIKDENKLTNNFLYLLVKSPEYQRKLKSIAAGCAQPNISAKQLESIEVIIPPLQTQKKIVAILEKAERLKEWRKEADELTDEFLKNTFLEMFGDPINNEHDFDVGTIRNLTIKTQYGTSKKANEDGNGIPILRMGNITYSGNFDFSSLKHIEFDEIEKRKYLVNKGELLFNRTNSKELVGKSAVYRMNEPMAFAGYLIKLITDSTATSEFIAGHLNSKYGKSYLQKIAKNIVGMANINAQEVQNIPIVIPPLELQQKFASIVQQVEQLREHQSQSRQHIDDLFNVLMQKAFKGDLI